MRSSLQLTFVALLSSVVYGFSSPMMEPHNLEYKRRGDRASVTPKASLASMPPRSGGAKKAAALQAVPVSTGTKCPATGAATIAASLWGTGGVLYILAKAVKRVLPIALEPFEKGAVPLSQFQLA